MQLTLPLPPARHERGSQAYHAGRSAEAAVARHYIRNGLVPIAERWKGKGGEIDLILRDGEIYVFVEVKKSRSFDAALCSLRKPQILRIQAAASEYLANTPRGQLTDMRFDLALMDNTGQLRVIENGFGHF